MPRIGIGSETMFGIEGFTRQSGITAVDAQVVDATYGQEEADVIADLRTKLDSVIDKLEALKLLTTA